MEEQKPLALPTDPYRVEAVVGADAAWRHIGFALIPAGNEPVPKATCAIDFRNMRNWTDGEVFSKIRVRVQQILTELHIENGPSVLALEETYLGKDVSAKGKLDRVGGMVETIADQLGWRIERIAAATWQAAVNQGGPRLKRDDIKRVSKKVARWLYGQDISEDESDAVHIARAVWKKLRDEKYKAIGAAARAS